MLAPIIIAYIILAGVKFWKFMYQRIALNVCRASEIPLHFPHSFFLNRMEKRLSNPDVRIVKQDFIEENEKVKIELLLAVKAAREGYEV